MLAPRYPLNLTPQPLPSSPRVWNFESSLSSEWSDTVIDGKGMLHGLEIEIGKLLVYAVWSVQTPTAIFAFIRFFLFFCEKKARGHEFLKGLL